MKKNAKAWQVKGLAVVTGIVALSLAMTACGGGGSDVAAVSETTANSDLGSTVDALEQEFSDNVAALEQKLATLESLVEENEAEASVAEEESSGAAEPTEITPPESALPTSASSCPELLATVEAMPLTRDGSFVNVRILSGLPESDMSKPSYAVSIDGHQASWRRDEKTGVASVYTRHLDYDDIVAKETPITIHVSDACAGRVPLELTVDISR